MKTNNVKATNMNKISFMLAAVTVALMGCSETQDPAEWSNVGLIKGTVAPLSSSMTKVSSASDLRSESVQFKWEEGDVVLYSLNDDEDNPEYATAECVDAENGLFEFDNPTLIEPGKTYQVIYINPSAFDDECCNEEYRKGDISIGHIIEGTGTSTGFSLFSHQPILHLSLKGNITVGKIELYQPNDTTRDNPLVTVQTCGEEGVELSDNPTDFYISFNYPSMNEEGIDQFVIDFMVKIYDTEDIEYTGGLTGMAGPFDEEEDGKILDMPLYSIYAVSPPR